MTSGPGLTCGSLIRLMQCNVSRSDGGNQDVLLSDSFAGIKDTDH